MKTFVTLLGLVALLPIVMVFGYAFNGWVLVKLWTWFAVPILGLPPLSLLQAIGIATLVGWITRDARALKEKEQKWYTTVSSYIFGGLMTVLSGYVVHRMM